MLNSLSKALLGAMAGMKVPDPATMNAADYRQFLDGMQLPKKANPDVRTEDIAHGPVPLRIYRPLTDAVGTLIFFHGGGYVVGGLDSHDGLCREFAAKAHCYVVAVDYRLAPEHRFPAAVEDAFSSALWIVEHAEELGLDGSRLAVGGDSAGATLAAVTALRYRDMDGTPRLRHQLLLYPAVDPTLDTPSRNEFAAGYGMDRQLSDWFLKQYVRTQDDLNHWWLAPLKVSELAGLPSTTLITAGCDPLRDEGEAFATRLEQSGIPVSRERIDGVFHGFMSLYALLPDAARAIELAAANLRSAFSDDR